VELVLHNNTTYSEVIEKGWETLGLSHEQEFIVTTPGGVVIPGNFCDWTIGDYKKRKRLSGQLSVAVCQKMSY
jgi:hypothetical protein